MSLLDEYEEYKKNNQQGSLLQEYEQYKQQNQMNLVNSDFSFNMRKPIVSQIRNKVNSLTKEKQYSILNKIQESENIKIPNVKPGVSSSQQNNNISKVNIPINLANKEETKNAKKINDSNLFSQSGKVIENAWLGGINGVLNLEQSLGNEIGKNQINQLEMFEKQNNELINNRLKDNANKDQIIDTMKKNSIINSNDLKENRQNFIQKKQEQKQKKAQKTELNSTTIDNPTMKKLSEIAQSVGQMAPAFIPGIGSTYLAGSAKGSYYDDAIQRGMSEEEADKYSGVMALAEATTEMIGIGNLSKAGKGVKALAKREGIQGFKNVLKNTANEEMNQSVKTVLKNYGIGIADNVIQEAIIDPIQELTAQTVAGKDKANWGNMGQRMLQDGLNGGLVSAIIGGANIGIQSCVGVVEKVQNNKQISQQEFKKAVQDAGTKLDISKIVEDNIEHQIHKYEQQVIRNDNNEAKNNENEILRNKSDQQDNKFIIKDDEVKYIDNENNENEIYFRFDNKGGFKGKEHQSGVSMWEEQVDDLLSPNYESYMTDDGDIDFQMAEKEVNSLLESYNLDYDQYNNLPDEEKSIIKREFALDNGYITNGASAFRLNEDGINEYLNYIKGHPINEYEETNFFTGQKNGFGADGEYVVKPQNTLYTNLSKNITSILEDDDISNNEKMKKITEIISQNNIANNQKSLYNSNESEGVSNAELSRDIYGRGRGIFENGIIPSSEENINIRNRPESQTTSFETEQGRKYQEFVDYADKNKITFPTKSNSEIISEGKNLGLDVVLFSGKGNFDYLGMTDKQNPNKIYIDVNQNETHGKDILYHEFLHSLKRSGNTIFNDKIQPILDNVIEDKTVIDNFIKEKRIR